MKTQRTLMLVVVAGLLLCFSTAQARMDVKEYSGFLGDYSELKPGPKGGAKMAYIKDGVDFSTYDKIMLDQVVFYFSPNAKNKEVDPEQMKELADMFHKALFETLGSDYPLVDQPGPDVMRLRIAITDIDLPNRPLNAITTVVPVGLAISLVKQGATGKGSFVGEISMEFEALDSVTNERLAAAADRQAGGKIDSMSTFGTAEDAFKFWAQRLRTKLDELHGKTKSE